MIRLGLCAALVGGLLLAPVGGFGGPLPEGYVRLADVAPGIATDMRYARAFNFTDGPVPGYDSPTCILTQTTAKALVKAEAALNAQGFALIVFDCYRPQRAVDFFAEWAAQEESPDTRPPGAVPALDTPPDQPTAKDVFFPDFAKSELHAAGFIARTSGHSLGHTVDVGLKTKGHALTRPDFADSGRCDGPFATRAPESDLDLGTAFDCFSALSAHDAKVSPAARQNRATLRKAMAEAGFVAYGKEWWHYRNARDPVKQAQTFPVD